MTDDQATTDELFCPKCDYSLRGLGADTDSCPECGETFTLAELRQPQIPWSHRREIGRCRAYWRTVWMVMFRNRRFCREVCRPVSWSDARRFRWVTILHVYVGLTILTMSIGRIRRFEWFDDYEFNEWLGPIWPLVIGHVLLLLWLTAVTGMQSYWCHPRQLDARRQSRAVALSYYACAPLAWMPWTAALLGYAFVTYLNSTYRIYWQFPEFRIAAADLLRTPLPLALGYALASLQVVSWWLVQTQIVSRAARRSGVGLLAFAAAIPACWLLLAALIFVGIPLVVGYTIIVISSLA